MFFFCFTLLTKNWFDSFRNCLKKLLVLKKNYWIDNDYLFSRSTSTFDCLLIKFKYKRNKILFISENNTKSIDHSLNL
jgi:hypothetical protein